MFNVYTSYVCIYIYIYAYIYIYMYTHITILAPRLSRQGGVRLRAAKGWDKVLMRAIA